MALMTLPAMGGPLNKRKADLIGAESDTRRKTGVSERNTAPAALMIVELQGERNMAPAALMIVELLNDTPSMTTGSRSGRFRPPTLASYTRHAGGWIQNDQRYRGEETHTLAQRALIAPRTRASLSHRIGRQAPVVIAVLAVRLPHGTIVDFEDFVKFTGRATGSSRPWYLRVSSS